MIPVTIHPLPLSVTILTFLATFVSGGRGVLVAPHADAGRSVPIIVRAQSHLLRLRVCLVALPAACRSALRPFPEISGADAVLPIEGTHLPTGLLRYSFVARVEVGDLITPYKASRNYAALHSPRENAVLQEQTILSLSQFYRCGALLVVVGYVIDPRADRIAPHQPSIAGFQQIRHRCSAPLKTRHMGPCLK